VCVREREGEWVCVFARACLCIETTESCMCVCAIKRERKCVCVCDREGESVCVRES